MARLFLARVAFFLFSVVTVSFSWGDIKSVAARKPNVLMIIVDVGALSGVCWLADAARVLEALWTL